MILKILGIYLLIGWLIGGYGLFCSIWRNESVFDDDNNEALIKMLYWFPLLLFVLLAYMLNWTFKLVRFTRTMILRLNEWRKKGDNNAGKDSKEYSEG